MAINGPPTSSQTTSVEQASGSEGQPEAARRPSVVSASNSTEQPQTGAAAATADLPPNASPAAASGAAGTETPGIKEFLWSAFNSMRQKWLHKKLDNAWASGVLSRIERKVTEMNALHYNNLSERQFDALLNEGKELLAQLSSSVQLWQEDEAFLERVHNSYVMVLSLKLLGEKTSTDKNTLGSTSCSMKCIYERSISALVKGSPLPWDFDSIYTKIQALFNRADGSASATRPPIDFEKMVLEDVPLDSSLKLPRTCCLRLFGLPSQAEDEEIRSAYRRLCLQYHPDKNLDNPAYEADMFLRVQIVASSLKL